MNCLHPNIEDIMILYFYHNLYVSFWEYSFIINKHNHGFWNVKWLLECEVKNLVYFNVFIF